MPLPFCAFLPEACNGQWHCISSSTCASSSSHRTSLVTTQPSTPVARELAGSRYCKFSSLNIWVYGPTLSAIVFLSPPSTKPRDGSMHCESLIWWSAGSSVQMLCVMLVRSPPMNVVLTGKLHFKCSWRYRPERWCRMLFVTVHSWVHLRKACSGNHHWSCLNRWQSQEWYQMWFATVLCLVPLKKAHNGIGPCTSLMLRRNLVWDQMRSAIMR